MIDVRLIDELVRRAKISAADAEAVLDALAQLTKEGWGDPPGQSDAPDNGARHHFEPGPFLGPAAAGRSPAAPAEPFVPTTADVDALVDAARRHPLGVDFLLGGHLGSVAATFKAHAFTVEAARARIWSER